MITMAKMMYDMYIKPRLGEKGQDMVEYALMLAIIVGIGWLIYQQTNLAGQINNVFNNAGSLMTEAAKTLQLQTLVGTDLLIVALVLQPKNSCLRRSSFERASAPAGAFSKEQ